MNLQEAFDQGFDAVKAYIDDALASFESRLKAVEARKPEKGDKGEPGIDGKPGEPGRDGKDCDQGEIMQLRHNINELRGMIDSQAVQIKKVEEKSLSDRIAALLADSPVMYSREAGHSDVDQTPERP